MLFNVSPLSKTNLILLGLTYFFYYGQLGVLVPYIGVFLDGRGYSSEQIGQILAYITIARIIGPNLWSVLASYCQPGLFIMRLGAFLAFICTFLAYYYHGFWIVTLSLGLMMMFWTAIVPQLEVVAMDCCQGSAQGYANLRMWGSIGFIVLSIILGALLDMTSTEVVLYSMTLVLFALFVMTCMIATPEHPVERTDQLAHNQAQWQLARSAPFVLFILSALLLQFSLGPFYTFFALYAEDLGYTGAQTGWLVALGVIAEIAMFFVAGRLLQRFSLNNMLIISMVFTALRWYLLAYWAESTILVIISQLLHAFSFGLTHCASISFIHRYFDKSFQARGQAIYVSVAFGVGGAAGSYLGGLYWDQGAGAQFTFILSMGIALLAGAILLFARHPLLQSPAK